MFRPAIDLFGSRAAAYAAHRPTYPAALADFLVSTAPGRDLAIDVGCGSGQLTPLLAERFDRVVGCDPSLEQLRQMARHQRVRLVAGLSEVLPFAARRADMVVAAQAAHWFDLPRFFGEARRVVAPTGLVALIGYGLPQIDAGIDGAVRAFHDGPVGPYWLVGRKLPVEGYSQVDFPFQEVETPTLRIARRWSFQAFIDYLDTWSGLTLARRQTGADPLPAFAASLVQLWGARDAERDVTWPIWMRVGRA